MGINSPSPCLEPQQIPLSDKNSASLIYPIKTVLDILVMQEGHFNFICIYLNGI